MMIPLELSLKRVYQGVHMRASKSLSYVIDEASAEAVSGRKKFISQEHIFIGILKLTGKTASDIISGREDNTQALSREISELKQLFEQVFEIRIEHMTAILRLETMLSRKVVPVDVDALQNRAKEIARMRGSSMCCAVDLLNAILENPPETLRAAMRIEKWKDRSSEWPHGTVYVEDESDDTVYEEGESDGTLYEEDEADGTVCEGDESVEDVNINRIVPDQYRILSDAIEGGMGSVWRVHHKSWDVDLAMKRPKSAFFVSEKQKEGFIRECDSWIRLGLHPNIVSCYYVR